MLKLTVGAAALAGMCETLGAGATVGEIAVSAVLATLAFLALVASVGRLEASKGAASDSVPISFGVSAEAFVTRVPSILVPAVTEPRFDSGDWPRASRVSTAAFLGLGSSRTDAGGECTTEAFRCATDS